MRLFFVTTVLSIFALTGCSAKPSVPPPAPPTNAGTPATPPKGPPAINPPPVAQPPQKSSVGNVPAPPVPVPASPVGGNPKDGNTVAAQPGVASQGRSLDGHEGLLVTPVKVYFRAKEMAVFTIQVPGALQLYKANDPQGKAPQTHEDYMTHVINANNIKLPMLPPGHKYVYDPKTEELMVERPQ